MTGGPVTLQSCASGRSRVLDIIVICYHVKPDPITPSAPVWQTITVESVECISMFAPLVRGAPAHDVNRTLKGLANAPVMPEVATL